MSQTTEQKLERLEGVDPTDYHSQVRFAQGHAQPPSLYYVTRDDTVIFDFWSPITSTDVRLSVRMMLADGQIVPWFRELSTGTTGATPFTFTLTGAQGYLLSASVETPGAPRGQCFVSLRIKRGLGTSDATGGDVLLQGYPGSSGAIGYPQTPAYSSLEGRGRMRVSTVANPAAGADWVTAVPAGVNWILRCVTAKFVTSVTVADRLPALQVTDGAAHVVGQFGEGITVPAAHTTVYSWFPGGFTIAIASSTPQPLISDLRLLAGWTIGTLTDAIAGTDQWSAIVVTVEEFIAG